MPTLKQMAEAGLLRCFKKFSADGKKRIRAHLKKGDPLLTDGEHWTHGKEA